MKKLLVILSLLVGTNSFAGILIEPYVGYHLSEAKQSGGATTDISGLGFGGRIGWTLPLVFIAFDYSTASGLDFEPDGGTKGETDYTAMGVVVGASLPIIRVWAGYNFSAELDVKDAAKFEGNGMKAGLGFKMPILPISFNLEYLINTYDEVGGVALSNDVEQKGLFVSVSAPFNL